MSSADDPKVHMVIVEGLWHNDAYLVPHGTAEEELMSAKKQFHTQYPGMAGTIKSMVRVLPREEP